MKILPESGLKSQKAKLVGKQHSSRALYSSKIIKAGALIGDTKTLFSNWDVDTSVQINIERIQRDNVFGKASRSRVDDILAIFRGRYLTERAVTAALVTLVKRKFSTSALEKLFYFHSAHADRLLYDTVTETLAPLWAKGYVDINVGDLRRSLSSWMDQGKTTGPWSEITITRVAQELLSSLREDGQDLKGLARKLQLHAALAQSSRWQVNFEGSEPD